MKRPLAFILLLFLSISFIAPFITFIPQVQATTYFSDNFDDGTLNAWTTHYASATTNAYHSASYSAYIYGGQCAKQNLLASYDSAYMEAWVYFPSNHTILVDQTQIISFDWGPCGAITAGTNDHLKGTYFNSTGEWEQQDLGAIVNNTWYKIGFYFVKTSKIDFYISGTKVATSTGGVYGSNQITLCSIGAWSNGNWGPTGKGYFIDDVIVQSDAPAPPYTYLTMNTPTGTYDDITINGTSEPAGIYGPYNTTDVLSLQGYPTYPEYVKSYIFYTWNIDGANITNPIDGSGNPHDLTMNTNHTATAIFGSNTLDFAWYPNIGNGVSNCTETPTYVEGTNYTVPFATTLHAITAYPDSGWSFYQWHIWQGGADWYVTSNPYGDLLLWYPYFPMTNYGLEAEFNYYTSNLTMLTPSGTGTVDPTIGLHSYTTFTNVTVTAYAGTNYVFDHWIIDSTTYYDNPHTENMTTNKNVQAFFITTSLTVTAPSGSGTTTPTTGIYPETPYTNITLSATASGTYDFDHWIIDTVTYYNNPIEFNVSNTDHTAQAIFTTKTLTVSTSVGSGTVSPSIGIHAYNNNTVVMLAGTASSGHAFYSWHIGGSEYFVNNYNLTMNADFTVYCTFYTFYLNMSATTGVGTGSTTPVSPSSTPCTPYANKTLTAVAGASYWFVKWIITGSGNYTDNPFSWNMTQSWNITAMFGIRKEYVRYQTPVGSGAYTRDGYGHENSLVLYLYGTDLEIGANPATGWTFDHWIIDDSLTTTKAQIIRLTANGPHTLIPVFRLAETGSADYMAYLISSMLTMILLMCLVPFVLASYYGRFGFMIGIGLMTAVGLMAGSFGAAYWQILIAAGVGVVLMLLGRSRSSEAGT